MGFTSARPMRHPPTDLARQPSILLGNTNNPILRLETASTR